MPTCKHGESVKFKEGIGVVGCGICGVTKDGRREITDGTTACEEAYLRRCEYAQKSRSGVHLPSFEAGWNDGVAFALKQKLGGTYND